MGAHAWIYFVPYRQDIAEALQELKVREFMAGRYNPVQPILGFPLSSDAPALRPAHASIEAAIEAAESEGTRSILDMRRIGERPHDGVVVPLSSQRLLELFGTSEPTREMIAESDDLYGEIERGQGIYIIVFEGGRPSEICFAGYSYD